MTVEGANVDPALAFIRARKGYESFVWTPPKGVAGLYRCKSYTPRDQGGGFFTLTMEFEQVYAP